MFLAKPKARCKEKIDKKLVLTKIKEGKLGLVDKMTDEELKEHRCKYGIFEDVKEAGFIHIDFKYLPRIKELNPDYKDNKIEKDNKKLNERRYMT